MPQFLTNPSGKRLAYERLEGHGPFIVFLGGFMSDMSGSKAHALAAYAAREGRAFLRFDYSGHGASEGAFTDGCVGDWADDAAYLISKLTSGPVILVGSSMGGWISLLLCKRPEIMVAGLVTIAAAPDFTEDGIWPGLNAAEQQAILTDGVVMVPAEGYEGDYPITRRLIEDGRQQLVMRSPLTLSMPVRFLHGTADTIVSLETALRLLEHARGPDIRLCLQKGADHSFSTPRDITAITRAIEELAGASP